MVKVRKSYVVVVGCGGVGSWAALMLLRSYVSFSTSASAVCRRARLTLTCNLVVFRTFYSSTWVSSALTDSY